ncbi:MAG: 16S rRNA (cytidine(1402)-2'-O)-methyltransferase [Firmicutes bacterium]|nr:16S rRNA (cytidine(1402)-2'-O)-methyltransferase [Bacillota bacterium]
MISQKSYANEESSILYLIPTPIGNMEDITLRAINTLEKVDFLLCEDTRVTMELLQKLNIKKKLFHCDDHNENEVKEMVVNKLKQGAVIGLVTDRGTPIISDPGYRVSQFVIENGYPVISLPGPTAFVPALTMSGLNPSPFLFYGFLNSKETKREKELEKLKSLFCTLIFYEAPHRIKDMLISVSKILGNRRIALCREISKKYEEILRGSVEDVLSIVDGLKGEMVVVVEGNTEIHNFDSLTILEHIKLYLEDGMSEKDAIKKVAVERNIPKSSVYKEYHIDNK